MGLTALGLMRGHLPEHGIMLEETPSERDAASTILNSSGPMANLACRIGLFLT
jgi:hypothetical protein